MNETPSAPVYAAREWYRFFDTLHTYMPTSATFTPDLTPAVNIAAVSAGPAFYVQMGTVVTLTGTLTLNPVIVGNTAFFMAPPVLDGLTLSTAAGTFVTTASGFSDVGSVVKSGGGLQFRIAVSNTAAAVYAFNVNYQIA